MTTTQAKRTPEAPMFEPPGPGEWTLDTTHHGRRPVTPFMRDMAVQGFETGFARFTERFGLPLATMRAGLVHGHIYARPVPVGEGDKPRGNPPAPIMWLVSRLHPELRRRNKAAARAWRDDLWRNDVNSWFDGGREVVMTANLRFQATDPGTLSDNELAAHLDELVAFLGEQYIAGFETHGGDIIPVGDFLASCAEWGLAAEEVAPLLAGASPLTLETRDLLAPVADAVAASEVAPETVDDIRRMSPAADEAVSRWLELHGSRLLTSDDIDSPTLNEQPALQARILANLGSSRTGEPSIDPAELRIRVPGDERKRFDTLLANARYGLRLRDDNVGLRLNWPAGLARRALLEAGERLTKRGSLSEVEHTFCLKPDEAAALLRGQTAPTAGLIAERSEERASQLKMSPPDRLGPQEKPPPLGLFPGPMRRVTAAVLALIEAMEGPNTQKPLSGFGVGNAVYTGRACVIASPDDDLDRIQAGDVLIAPFTSPSFNSVLPLVGAIAAEEGGVLSHTAIVAREFGIPAVVGARGLLSTIQDGQMVEVDPTAGTVRVTGY